MVSLSHICLRVAMAVDLSSHGSEGSYVAKGDTELASALTV